ncbi:hypothetical protein FSP39_008728 [Pinctada imbricata]|uniref:AAA+ ATPase domain-containing protein n=1 Tax=Pinctada imbricata TaxID=66713 RepID=A0AA88XQT6_PINIB|nr:hypothetical protein FSP39_008728 [Pinctada imbricata]
MEIVLFAGKCVVIGGFVCWCDDVMPLEVGQLCDNIRFFKDRLESGVHSCLVHLQRTCLEKRVHTLARSLHRAGYLDRKSLSEIQGFFREFHSSKNLHQNEDGKRDRDRREDQMPPFPVKVLLLLLISYLLLQMVSRIETPKQQVDIPWNVFINDYLLKGEVSKIVVHKNPFIPGVFATLQPGVKVNGRPVFKDYMIRVLVPSIEKIEDKIRDEEDKLGIAPSERIPIEYRTQHVDGNNVPLLLTLMIPFMIMFYLMKRRAPPRPGRPGNKQDQVKRDSEKDIDNGFDFIVDEDIAPGVGIFKIISNDEANVEMISKTAVMEKGNIRQARHVRGDYLYKSKEAIRFKDVAGLKEAKIEVMEFVDYLKNPKHYKKIGAKIPHGALLLGPPGCGKTLLAKALATEAKVPFFATAGSEFVEMIGGLGASRVRDLFKKARNAAPCIIYIDEIDAIGKKRTERGGDGGNSEEENTLIQILAEMDGFTTEENVIVLGSTNRADMLDQALLRPGRFDRHIMIDLPTMSERLELFELYMGKLALGFPLSTAAPRLAQLTPGLSGADINNICNEAAINAARLSQNEVKMSDFDYACERVMTGSAKKTNVLSPFEKKVNAYYMAGHVLVSWLLKSPDALLKVSIIPRTNQQLGFSQFLPNDNKLYTTEQLFERMCVHLGGSVTEAVIFNHSSTASEKDLKVVRKIAYDIIRRFGMNDNIGQLSFNINTEEDETMIKPYSKSLSALIDQEVMALVAKANLSTKEVIEKNKDKLDKLAEALVQKESLTYEDITNLIGPPPHGDKRPKEYAEPFMNMAI